MVRTLVFNNILYIKFRLYKDYINGELRDPITLHPAQYKLYEVLTKISISMKPLEAWKL